MSFQSLTSAIQRLQSSVEALAALGAELRIRREGLVADPHIGRQLEDVIHALDPALLDRVTAEQEETALSIIQSAMRQAIDLLDNPVRAPGWAYDDPDVLQGQGRTSRRFVQMISAAASQRPDLQQLLQGPGTVLDVGTGVGWFAIEAIRAWPAIRCVGIDIWEPSLRLARANLAGSATEDRIELRAQSVLNLDERDAYILAWFPAAFIPAEIVPDALTKLRDALAPGGWLVFSTFSSPPESLAKALVGLKVARHGAHPWTPVAAEEQLRGLGFERVATCPSDAVSTLVVGRRPGLS
jgi:SAM-dependent methyltransferase